MRQATVTRLLLIGALLGGLLSRPQPRLPGRCGTRAAFTKVGDP